MQDVTVCIQNHLLSVTPACERLFKDSLAYWEKSYNMAQGFQIKKTRLYFVDNDVLYASFGLYDRVVACLTSAGCNVHGRDMDVRPDCLAEPDYKGVQRFMHSRGDVYRVGQMEALATIIGSRTGVIVAPPGWGKSYLTRLISKVYPRAKIVLTAPSVALVGSAYDELLKYTPDVGRVGGGCKDPDHSIVVSTAHSLKTAVSLGCDILLYDECHICPAPKRAADLAEVISPYKQFGFTATPVGRADGAELVMESFFGPIRCRVSYSEAENAGAVVPVKVNVCSLPRGKTAKCNDPTGMQVLASKKRAAYWRNTSRNKLLVQEARRLEAQLIAASGATPQVLYLTETLEHAAHLGKRLPGVPLIYAGVTPDRLAGLIQNGLLPEGHFPPSSKQLDEYRRDFESGKLKKAIATKVWGTGVDFTHLRILVYASGEPGKIPVTQWGGRVTRTEVGKACGYIIDCQDTFSSWTTERARARMRVYKSHKWAVSLVNTK